MPQYIVANSWSHIFLEEDQRGISVERERTCRFVMDRDDLDMVRVDVEVDGNMRAATDAETADLLDSIVNANPDVIDDPKRYGFSITEQLPRWCRTKVRPTSRS